MYNGLDLNKMSERMRKQFEAQRAAETAKQSNEATMVLEAKNIPPLHMDDLKGDETIVGAVNPLDVKVRPQDRSFSSPDAKTVFGAAQGLGYGSASETMASGQLPPEVRKALMQRSAPADGREVTQFVTLPKKTLRQRIKGFFRKSSS